MVDIIKWIKVKEYYQTFKKLIDIEELLNQEELNGSIYAYSPNINEFLSLNISSEQTKQWLEELKPGLLEELKKIENEILEMLSEEKLEEIGIEKN